MESTTTQDVVTHEVIARQHATPVLVQAIEPEPGLFVYRQPDELLKKGDRYVWRLGHHSGYQIAKFEYPGDADDAAWAIRDITDWTRPVDEIRADTDGGIVRDALVQSPGIFLNAHPDAS
ncbi:hypothetical protein GTY83_07310 [Streptomyces sp. SID4928]|uniref:hypothetical protein n=1 Tax=unclassified Streptomyces TaxID=2593676 RepID=UPI0001C1C403|nr:hypothetical protein [Streptomyces sp. ACT-1]EGE40848.1 hypothetical protein SACT1_1483 [Streptomyces sp. ACT-1]MYR48913.1 hypothetical protein [Streptomyces sp. SID4928]